MSAIPSRSHITVTAVAAASAKPASAANDG
jgi:hypothetical protein